MTVSYESSQDDNIVNVVYSNNLVTIATPGPQGTPGMGATNLSFTYEKQIPDTTWVISHNLGYRPSVTVQDYGKISLEGDVNYTDVNNLTITFSASVSGFAYLS